ncbi:MAG: response regulator transcription factor [Alphaproteobacteria bacterium]|nr:MAG: response regulator transcription factor [Alphaproteobacteria bacterium]
MFQQPKIVYIVDDDREARISLQMLLRSAGMNSWPFGSATDILELLPHLAEGCLLVDLRMPGMDGISLLTELENRGVNWPAVVVSGQADVSSAVAALRLGVVDFLEKPYSEDELLAAIERCFERVEGDETIKLGQARIAALSPREREALEGVIRGESSKQVAKRLNLSPRTVEMHRARMMRKLGVRSATDALGMAAAAGYRIGGRPDETA